MCGSISCHIGPIQDPYRSSPVGPGLCGSFLAVSLSPREKVPSAGGSAPLGRRGPGRSRPHSALFLPDGGNSLAHPCCVRFVRLLKAFSNLNGILAYIISICLLTNTEKSDNNCLAVNLYMEGQDAILFIAD